MSINVQETLKTLGLDKVLFESPGHIPIKYKTKDGKEETHMRPIPTIGQTNRHCLLKFPYNSVTNAYIEEIRNGYWIVRRTCDMHGVFIGKPEQDFEVLELPSKKLPASAFHQFVCIQRSNYSPSCGVETEE